MNPPAPSEEKQKEEEIHVLMMAILGGLDTELRQAIICWREMIWNRSKREANATNQATINSLREAITDLDIALKFALDYINANEDDDDQIKAEVFDCGNKAISKAQLLTTTKGEK